MIESGRFETSTKTKIKTEHGTVLKVVTYGEDCIHPSVEYRIRGICKYCGDKLDCWCFTDEYCKNPLQEAKDYLVGGFICDEPTCVIKSMKKNDPEKLKEFMKMYGEDEYAVRNAIQESWGEWDDGPELCGI